MKKNVLIIVLIVFIFCFCFCFFPSSKEKVLVNYNGNNLMISIDGESATTLPLTGTYYLTDYLCDDNNTQVMWDNDNYELFVSNGESPGGISCDLTFKSKPLLNEMAVGSYVSYEGVGGTVGMVDVACQKDGTLSSDVATDETESSNSCLGQNARGDLDNSGYTYGYCDSPNYKFYTQGWRIAYVDSVTNKVALISAGSPECNSRIASTANTNYIKMANALALKYCNSDYVDGDCTCVDTNEDGSCDTASTDAWAINDNDFYNITKAISGVGKRVSSGSSSLGDIGGTLGNTLFCNGNSSYKECGYDNDLIDIGGYYWIAAQYTDSSTYGVFWYPHSRYIYSYSVSYALGLRPVISLSSSVFVTGGRGTMDRPYIISNNK